MALENILARIRSDAEEKAASILSESEKEKEGALAAYRAELEEHYADESKKLKQKARELLDRMSFHVQKEAEREIASATRALMDQAISAAVKKLSHLDDRRYLDLVSGLIERSGADGEIEVVISKSDEDRITQSFLDGLSKPDLTLRLSSDRHRFEKGGVILRGRGISINATFAMIARLAHEDLVMELSKMLASEPDEGD